MPPVKLLLDQGLPRTAAGLLRESGIDAVHVGEIGYAEAEDDMILQFGRKEGYVIVTLDADFHSLMALSESSEPSVIRIRIEGLKAKAAVDLLKCILNLCAHELVRGSVISVQENRIRIRELPLTSEKL